MSKYTNAYYRELWNSSPGESHRQKLEALSKEMTGYWEKISEKISVTRDHPHYRFIMNRIYHDGNQFCSLIYNWLRMGESKDDKIFNDKVWEYGIELLKHIQAAEFIVYNLEMERKIKT